MDFISGLYQIYLKDRFAALKEYAGDFSDIQSEQLSNLLLEAANTEFGKKHNFASVYSYQEFRERLPIQRMADLQPYLQRIRNGETDLLWPGSPKAIVGSLGETEVPITLQAIEETFLQGIGDSYALFLNERPGSKLLEGFSANVGNGERFPCMNELYGLLRANEPFISSLLNLPKRVGKDKDGNPSPELVLQETMGQKVTSFRGASERLTALLKSAARKTGKSDLKALWPNAEILFESGPKNSAQLAESKKELPEGIHYKAIFSSPEGIFGIQDQLADDAFLLMLDLSTFYEFIPVNGNESDIVPLEDTEPGIDYELVITNCSGLWRCRSEGPHLRFVSTAPYRFILV